MMTNVLQNILKLELIEAVPVYLSPLTSLEVDIKDLYAASCTLTQLMAVSHIESVNVKMTTQDVLRYVEIELKMSKVKEVNKSAYFVTVVMPACWSPRVYLSLLELSINKNKLL